MPRRLWVRWAPALGLAFAVSAFALDPARGSDREAASAQPGTDRDEALAAWDRAAAPGPWHAFLAERAGKWRLAGRIWNDPQGEPVATTGEAELKPILDGRFLQEKLRAESAGVRYEGLGLLGCDNADSTVTFVWIDSAHTLTSVLRGRAAAPGQPLELRGETTDPASGRPLRLRVVLTFVGPDEHRWEYFGAPDGWDEARLMDLTYTRR